MDFFFAFSAIQRLEVLYHLRVSLAERSKAPDSSSGGEIRVGSNPTADIYCFGLVCSAAAGRQSIECIKLKSGVAQWLACWAHNSKVGGSKPLSAMFFKSELLSALGHPN